MYNSAIIFCCVLLIFVPLYNISNTELMERIGCVRELVTIKGTDGDKKRSVTVIFRWVMFLAFSLIALVTDEITAILNLAGGVAIPVVSFYIPVVRFNSVFPQFHVCQDL